MSDSKEDDTSPTASGASPLGEGKKPVFVLGSVMFGGPVTVDSPLSQSDSDDLTPHCSECGTKCSSSICGLILCDQHLPLGQHHDNGPDRMTSAGAPLCSDGSGVFAPSTLANLTASQTAPAESWSSH